MLIYSNNCDILITFHSPVTVHTPHSIKTDDCPAHRTCITRPLCKAPGCILKRECQTLRQNPRISKILGMTHWGTFRQCSGLNASVVKSNRL